MQTNYFIWYSTKKTETCCNAVGNTAGVGFFFHGQYVHLHPGPLPKEFSEVIVFTVSATCCL